MKNSEKVLVAILSFKRTLGVVALLVITLAIPVTLLLNQKTQTVEQQAAPLQPTTTPNPYANVSADVNNDGIVDITDYNMILACISQTQCQIQITDINGDGIVDRADYQIILNRYFESQPNN